MLHTKGPLCKKKRAKIVELQPHLSVLLQVSAIKGTRRLYSSPVFSGVLVFSWKDVFYTLVAVLAHIRFCVQLVHYYMFFLRFLSRIF